MSRIHTVEPSFDTPAVERRKRDRDVKGIVVAALVALVVGVIAGLAFAGSDDGVEPAYAVEGAALTSRQTEMVEMVYDYFAAWRAGDVDTLVAMYTSRGVFAPGRAEYRVDDGTFENYLRTNYPKGLELEAVEPMVVGEYRILTFNTRRGFMDPNVFEFTAIGDVKIIRHTAGTPRG